MDFYVYRSKQGFYNLNKHSLKSRYALLEYLGIEQHGYAPMSNMQQLHEAFMSIWTKLYEDCF